jgi:hypothetical protein
MFIHLFISSLKIIENVFTCLYVGIGLLCFCSTELSREERQGKERQASLKGISK